MNIYRIHVRSCDRYELIGMSARTLTQEAIVQTVAGVVIHELTPVTPGQWAMDLQLQRPNHQEALNDIFIALDQLGYAWVNATVSEWTDAIVQRALLGAFGGLAIGAPVENADFTLLAAALGGLVGAWLGSRVRTLEAMYQVTWNPVSGLTLTPISQPQRSTLDLRPGFSAS